MLEIPRLRGGGLQVIQRKTGSKQGIAAKCDQMPAMQRRGSGDLVELGRKETGDPGPGAWGLGPWGNWGEWGMGRANQLWGLPECGLV